ncbi:hypothetical protein C8R45DRAFT_931796 [Mycena sanguinolenta]|nr:hypothetical protein C8R45DRAFT_931796 [Mycena sanguinolenta]
MWDSSITINLNLSAAEVSLLSKMFPSETNFNSPSHWSPLQVYLPVVCTNSSCMDLRSHLAKESGGNCLETYVYVSSPARLGFETRSHATLLNPHFCRALASSLVEELLENIAYEGVTTTDLSAIPEVDNEATDFLNKSIEFEMMKVGRKEATTSHRSRIINARAHFAFFWMLTASTVARIIELTKHIADSLGLRAVELTAYLNASSTVSIPSLALRLPETA